MKVNLQTPGWMSPTLKSVVTAQEESVTGCCLRGDASPIFPAEHFRVRMYFCITVKIKNT